VTQYGLPLQIERKSLDGAEWLVEGYASTFGNTDLGGDIVAKGAFAAHLAAGAKTRFLYSHDPAQVLGTATGLSEDDSGLYGKFRISKTPLGESVRTLLKDGALDSFSIGYVPRDFDIDRKAGTRTLKDIELLEVSVVAMPMNPMAIVTGIKAAEVGYARLDLDELLRVYTEHRAAALEQAKALCERRRAEGRRLSDRVVERLEALRDASLKDADLFLEYLTAPPPEREEQAPATAEAEAKAEAAVPTEDAAPAEAAAPEDDPVSVRAAGRYVEAYLRRARLKRLQRKYADVVVPEYDEVAHLERLEPHDPLS
jgi:uncharacterized protein